MPSGDKQIQDEDHRPNLERVRKLKQGSLGPVTPPNLTQRSQRSYYHAVIIDNSGQKCINKLRNKREPTFTGPLQVWPMVYILYLFVARGHCTSVYILIQLLLTLLILVLSYIVFVDIVCNGLWKFYGYEFWGFTNCFSKKYGKFICI